MKIRAGFVTNSSSNNFTVFLKRSFDDNLLEEHPIIKVMYNFFISAFNDHRLDNPIINELQLENLYIKWYGYKDQTINDVFNDEPELKERFEKSLKLINDGYIMMVKSFPYDDSNACEAFLDVVDGVNLIAWE